MDRFLILIFLIVAVILVVYLLQSRRGGTPTLGKGSGFRKKDYLLTQAERSFYEVLRQSVGSEFQIFPKVRLVDILWLPQGTPNRQASLNRVISKHVDFVLCNQSALAPLLAIELDDASHAASTRKTRDALVESILEDAGLPLLRVSVKRGYVLKDLAQLVRSKVATPPV
jgi:hypothetical protein